MKFCSHCGAELMDEAVVCPKCGGAVQPVKPAAAPQTKYCTHCGAQVLKEAVICPKCGCSLQARGAGVGTGLQTAAKVLLILTLVGVVLSSVVMLFFAIYADYLTGVMIGEVAGAVVIEEMVDLTGLYYGMAALCAGSLLWMIPMTVHYCKAVKNQKPVGLTFKICTLLFVNPIAGILMLCDNSQPTTL